MIEKHHGTGTIKNSQLLNFHFLENLYEKEFDKIMIEVTKMNEKKIIINADCIESVEETPDTVITLSNGKKVIVKESRQVVKNLVILYKKEILGEWFLERK